MKRDREPDAAEDGSDGEEHKHSKKQRQSSGSPGTGPVFLKQEEDDTLIPGTGQGANGQESVATESKPELKEEEEDIDLVLPHFTSRAAVKKGSECPYLDTISRQALDFDFEKCCSVTLSPVNVYACLVCGKYFQGRGLNTPAYTHALETGHHMFMKLDNGKVYCLPDNYEVLDRSLADIQYQRDPQFTAEQIAKLDVDVRWARALDGTEYMPGLVGLNNMKNNDYANAVVQVLARIPPIRDFFLVPSNYAHSRSPLVQRFGELTRKLWNPHNFRAQVSPHEFMQAVIVASSKRFIIEKQSDPVEFWSWLLNTLHLELTGQKPKKASIITQCFQGELEVTTQARTGKGKAAASEEDLTERCPFLLLGLDLPPAPLFKDALEKNIIPQVPIFNLLHKFDGETLTDDIKLGRRRFRVTKLPPYLCLHMKRFTKNNFFIEKNPTIVNFPVKNLELKEILGAQADAAATKYDLVSNLVHDGKPGEGVYRVHIHRKVEDIWYEAQDLRVSEMLPQVVALSEAYFQVYEQKKQQ